jgi:hypothetical protein
MCCDPVFGQDLLPCPNAGRAIFDGDPQQQRVLRYMKDAVGAFGKDDDQIPRVPEEPAAPALPADGFSPGFLLLTLQPVRGGQGEQQQGEHDVHAYRPGSFLGWTLQTPLLLTLLDTAILDQTRVIVVVERLQGFVDRGHRSGRLFCRLARRLDRSTGVPPPHGWGRAGSPGGWRDAPA